jgi:hypothetical protein
MKTLFVIKTHSFVDLITNSSSELFVCNTDKTVKMAKEILIKLAKLYNQTQDLKENGGYKIDIKNLFTEIMTVQIADKEENDTGGQYSFGYTIKEGDLIIRSVEDNSIPYQMFDSIEEIFHASRHHLG